MADVDRAVEIDVVREDAKTTIRCAGAMDLHNYKEFDAALIEGSSAAGELVVDFVQVSYIDTAVLASLARSACKMIARDKRLKIMVTEPSHPLRTLQITGLFSLMDLVTAPKETPAA